MATKKDKYKYAPQTFRMCECCGRETPYYKLTCTHCGFYIRGKINPRPVETTPDGEVVRAPLFDCRSAGKWDGDNGRDIPGVQA